MNVALAILIPWYHGIKIMKPVRLALARRGTEAPAEARTILNGIYQTKRTILAATGLWQFPHYLSPLD